MKHESALLTPTVKEQVKEWNDFIAHSTIEWKIYLEHCSRKNSPPNLGKEQLYQLLELVFRSSIRNQRYFVIKHF